MLLLLAPSPGRAQLEWREPPVWEVWCSARLDRVAIPTGDDVDRLEGVDDTEIYEACVDPATALESTRRIYALSDAGSAALEGHVTALEGLIGRADTG